MQEIPESDWKMLRDLKPRLLERLCRRILICVQARCGVDAESYHQRYLSVFGDVEDGDAAIARIFDGLRRSNAISRIALMKEEGLIRKDEFSGFSATTRTAVERANGLIVPSKFARIGLRD